MACWSCTCTIRAPARKSPWAGQTLPAHDEGGPLACSGADRRRPTAIPGLREVVRTALPRHGSGPSRAYVAHGFRKKPGLEDERQWRHARRLLSCRSPSGLSFGSWRGRSRRFVAGAWQPRKRREHAWRSNADPTPSRTPFNAKNPATRGNGSGKCVNRRGKGPPDRRAKGTPWLVTDRGGSVRPCGASWDCAAGASAVGLGADC